MPRHYFTESGFHYGSYPGPAHKVGDTLASGAIVIAVNQPALDGADMLMQFVVLRLPSKPQAS
jgi:hypothetical protein